jgi:hypothetical protein
MWKMLQGNNAADATFPEFTDLLKTALLLDYRVCRQNNFSKLFGWHTFLKILIAS